MPTLPAPVARTALRVFGSPAQVCGVDDLSPGLRRVELRCDAPADRDSGRVARSSSSSTTATSGTTLPVVTMGTPS